MKKITYREIEKLYCGTEYLIQSYYLL